MIPSLEYNFEKLKGTYAVFVTDSQRRKYQPNLLTSKSPPIIINADHANTYNYKVKITKTVMQEEDPNAKCKEYGRKTFYECYRLEQEAFFKRKLSCVPPQFTGNASIMCRGKLDPLLFDTELANYFYDLELGGEPTNCTSPCTTLDISTTLTKLTPSSQASRAVLRIIFDREVTKIEVNFR